MWLPQELLQHVHCLICGRTEKYFPFKDHCVMSFGQLLFTQTDPYLESQRI